MDAAVIKFKASGQKLSVVSTNLFAANTVNYIRAEFELGDGWDGFDVVRAVWATDFAKIATILDTDGVTMVPWEVLRRTATLYVNLVGSISDGDELTDRLTTYKAKALDVNGCTNVDGDNTQPITPSQFEQYVQIVKDEVAKVKDIDHVEMNADYTLTFYFSDETEWTTPISIRGEQGETGNGIASAVLNADYTLTLNFTDGTHYTTPPIRGAQGVQGETGNGIESVYLTETHGAVKTYEILFTDGTTTTFDVTDGEVTLAELASVLPTDTASGAIASFEDGSDLFDYLSCIVNIDPVQDLHGYDKPWVGGSGKNKFDPTTANAGYLNSSGAVQPQSQTYYEYYSDYIPVSGNIISIGYFGYDSADSPWSAVAWYDENKVFLNRNNTSTNPNTIAIPQGAAYAVAMMRTFNHGLENCYFCVGNDLSFAPWENLCPITGWTGCEVVVSPTEDAQDGTTYNITWQTEAGTVYGGTVDVVTGVLTVTWGYTNLGVLNYSKSSSPQRFEATTTIPNAKAPISSSVALNGLCTEYKIYSIDAYSGQDSAVYMSTTGLLRIYDSSRYSLSASDFKTAMNNVFLAFELATPTTYQLDPVQVACLLGQNNVWADCGDIEKVRYKADVQLWVEKMLNA